MKATYEQMRRFHSLEECECEGVIENCDLAREKGWIELVDEVGGVIDDTPSAPPPESQPPSNLPPR